MPLQEDQAVVARKQLSCTVLEQRVDEGAECRLLTDEHQPAEQQQDDDDREQPELLADPHELPKIAQELAHGLSFARRFKTAFVNLPFASLHAKAQLGTLHSQDRADRRTAIDWYVAGANLPVSRARSIRFPTAATC
jgi:hypothetical protein